MQSAKEKASNVAASAKAGMAKTKATVEEKAEKMTTRDPAQKEMANAKKHERKEQAELNKQEAHDHSAATRHAAETTGTTGHTATGYGTTGVGYGTTDAGVLGTTQAPGAGHHPHT